MKNLTIGKRITVGFASVLLILFVFGLFIHTRVRVVRNGVTEVRTNSIPSLEYLADVQLDAEKSMSLVYQHISSESKTDMDDVEAQINACSKNIVTNLAEYEKLSSPEVKPMLDQFKARRLEYITKRTELLTLSRNATNAQATAEVYQKARAELDPLAAAYLDAVNKCEVQERKEAETSVNSVLSASTLADYSLILGGLASLIVAGGLAFVIIRSTNNSLNGISIALSDSSNQVASAASQVSSASQTLAQGSGEQAASIEETSASLEEMASMTKRNAEHAQKANDLAREARSAAERGSNDMQAMTTAMESIKGSSDDVAKIIKTIDEIAFQTNILALNAAVEAARAGEAGMGFAVVADEVRNLAQRSAQAAKETAVKIEGAITNTSQGVQISAKVAAALTDIVNKVRQVDELITEVSSASREQTQGITQINSAVGEMDKVTQSNAASAEESAAAAEELNAQAATLKQSVAELMVLVQGLQTVPAAPATAPVKISRPATGNKTITRVYTAESHSKAAPAPQNAVISSRRKEIPLESDFKDM